MAPYMATTCRELFFMRKLPLKRAMKTLSQGSELLPFSWLLSEGIRVCKQNLREILKALPPKNPLFVAIK